MSRVLKTNKDSLGERIKTFYEDRSKTYLTRRMPVMVRIDGRAFHTFTKGLPKPYDKITSNSMVEAMLHLCKNMEGCVLGYTQSDEITLVLCDYQALDSNAWFDYSVQKICSVAASMCTMAFNRAFIRQVLDLSEDDRKCYQKAVSLGATFDAKCFNIPKEEVTNAVLWRQFDCIRNSISSLARANFSHSYLKGRNGEEQKELLKNEKNITYDDFPPSFRKGMFAVKKESGWVVDYDIPILKGEERQYVESLINFEGE